MTARYIIKHEGANRRQRRAQYASSSSRSYPLLQINQRAVQEIHRGMNLIHKFVMRGMITVTSMQDHQPEKSRPFSMKNLALGIKRGIVGV